MKRHLRTFGPRFVTLALVCGLVACGGGGGGTGTDQMPPNPPGSLHSPQYFVGSADVSAITADPIADAAMDGSQPFVNIETIASAPGTPAIFPAAPPSNVPSAWQPIFAYRWASEAQMALDMPNVPSWIRVCMYDNETSDQSPPTPPNEQANPALYELLAAQLCHGAQKTYIPSAGVHQNMDPAQERQVFATATSWNGYSMQTQTAENEIGEFDSEIANYESSIRSINSHLGTYIVGVGDFAGGTLQPLSQIEAAARTAPAGSAFWLNFGPHGGPGCDSSLCPIPARPDLLVQFIKDFATK